ncbi:MAG: FUSC family protein [Methylocapsa sp.]|nr:FUSC family protein [Methylocapsa sp.]
MADAFGGPDWIGTRGALSRWSQALADAAKAAGPPLLFGLRLWASVCLALYIAFWLELDNPFWAGTSAAIVCQPHLGASLRKGWYRMIGTMVGAVAIVVLTALFPQARAPFLVALALWAAVCALVATLLRNFASYAAALAGYTAAIIASDELGATGGPDADTVFLLAVYRASEICIGIVSAGIVLAGTDFGAARRRLAGSFAALSAEITGRFTSMLALAGPDMPETQPVRRELARRVIALDPIIDEVKGESSQLRYHSPVLQKAVDGLLTAIMSWRTVAVALARLPDGEAQQGANAVLENTPQGLRAAENGVPAQWLADPAHVRETCNTAARTLATLPASTPPLRLLADQTARLLDGISDALNGLARLATALAHSPPGRGSVQIRVPDWLPALVNAGRAFVVIGIVQLFWVVTEWPNGALAITFAAISVLLLALQADRAYAAALGFTIGIVLAASLTAVIAFAVLPGLETFEAFSLAIGLYLIPAGALMATGVLTAQPRLVVPSSALILGFVPLLAPANVMSYDTQQYYNAALAIVSGSSTAAISFLLLPPLSPAFRTRRLLALTLRDLRRLAKERVSWTVGEWESRIFGRLTAMPDAAEPLQRSQLVAALAAGGEVIRLRRIASALGFGAGLDAALDAFAQGNSALAAVRLARLDERLAALSGSLALQARGNILAISDALRQHGSYFDSRIS